MIYRGTNFTERIQMTPTDRMHTTQWIEMRRFANSNRLEVALCDDDGKSVTLWNWKFVLDFPMTYEQIKFNIMEHMFECDTMDELADVLDDVFHDGFDCVIEEDEDCGCDECNCDECHCGAYNDEEKLFKHHEPEYVTTLKLGSKDDIRVDITDAGDMFESWLYRKSIGVKEYMFGWPKVQHPKSGNVEYYDLDDYIDMVRGNLWEYLGYYDAEYGD